MYYYLYLTRFVAFQRTNLRIGKVDLYCHFKHVKSSATIITTTSGIIMYRISDYHATKLEPLTFVELNMKEKDIEELLRQNIEITRNGEELMLIVGKK